MTEIKHKIDVNTQEHLAAKHLELNEVAYCNLHLDQPVAFEAYADNRTLGAVRATSVYLREDGGVGSTQQIDLVA